MADQFMNISRVYYEPDERATYRTSLCPEKGMDAMDKQCLTADHVKNGSYFAIKGIKPVGETEMGPYTFRDAPDLMRAVIDNFRPELERAVSVYDGFSTFALDRIVKADLEHEHPTPTTHRYEFGLTGIKHSATFYCREPLIDSGIIIDWTVPLATKPEDKVHVRYHVSDNRDLKKIEANLSKVCHQPVGQDATSVLESNPSAD